MLLGNSIWVNCIAFGCGGKTKKWGAVDVQQSYNTNESRVLAESIMRGLLRQGFWRASESVFFGPIGTEGHKSKSSDVWKKEMGNP